MIVRRALILVMVLVLIAAPAQARRKAVADLSQDFVAVTEGFDGAHLTVFGVLKSPADVAIVVEGPLAQAKVRTKKRQLGIWINGDPETFDFVPSYYAVVTSKPIGKMLSKETAKKYGIGTHTLPFADTDAGRGLVEVKRKSGLYMDTEEGVEILDSKLFRADIDLPASVPIGVYKTYIYEFSNGHLLASRTEEMRVAQVGLGATISELSRSQPTLYAVLSLVLTLGIGGGAAYLFRRRA